MRKHIPTSFQFSSVHSLNRVRLFATPWIAARQASLSITNSQSLPKLKSIELVMPSNHLILCHPLLLPSIFPSIRVFSNESVLHIKCPKNWSFSFCISPSNEYSGLISFRIDWFPCCPRDSQESSPTPWGRPVAWRPKRSWCCSSSSKVTWRRKSIFQLGRWAFLFLVLPSAG